MSYDPNQPQQPDSSQQPQPPYGQLQPPYQQPQGGQQPPPYYGQPQQPPYGQPQWGQQPPPQPQYDPTQYVGPYGAPPVPGYMPPQQPRQSRRALWIVLGIIGGILVLSCAFCGILFALGAGPIASIVGSIAGPTNVVNQYYNAIQRQDYPTAYSYLDTNLIATNGQTLTQDLYTTGAQALDLAKGKVSSFSIGNISLTNNNNTATVTVSVTRGSSPPYTVQLQLQKVNGTWKITSFNNI
jgi:hypothetical protein